MRSRHSVVCGQSHEAAFHTPLCEQCLVDPLHSFIVISIERDTLAVVTPWTPFVAFGESFNVIEPFIGEFLFHRYVSYHRAPASAWWSTWAVACSCGSPDPPSGVIVVNSRRVVFDSLTPASENERHEAAVVDPVA